MTEAGFRRCMATGLLVHLASQRLIVFNFLMGIISLIIGGIAAIFVGLTRSSFVLLEQLGLQNTYYYWLNLHGFNMLIFWILWFEVALIYFVATILLNAPLYSIRVGWLSFILMLIGWLIMNVMNIAGDSIVLFTAYIPLSAPPIFYIGYLLFALGVAVAVINFFLTLYKARIEGRYSGHLPLVTWGAGIAAIIGLVVVAYGAFAITYALLFSSNYGLSGDVMFYRWFFWGLGHSAQYVNVTAMVAVWYALLALGTGFVAAKFVNERYARIAFAMYTLFVVPGIGHHILVDPGFSAIFKQASGSVGSHFLSVPSMLHALALLGGVEATLRASGHTSLLGWLKKIPWRNPAISGMLLSMILFGIGGIIAQPQTTLQPNLLFHNTLWVPGHFHLTVVGGTTLAFMSLSYYIVPLLTEKKLISSKMSIIQIYLFFIGIFILTLSMAWLGWLGSPRRTFISYEELIENGWYVPATFLGIGALLAIVAGILFVLNMVLTVLISKKASSASELLEGLVSPIEIKDEKAVRKTGSLVIVIILLVFILLAVYFASFIRLEGLPKIW
jgi:cytochrome c oxidase subunit 1